MVRVGLAFLSFFWFFFGFFFCKALSNTEFNTKYGCSGPQSGWGGREGGEDRRQGKRKERKEEGKGRKRRALNIAESGEGERKRVRREEIGDGPLAVTLQWSPLSEILPPS